MKNFRRLAKAIRGPAAVVAVCFLLAAGLRACGAAPPPRDRGPSEARLLKVAEDGKPVVEAIHRFRRERGLWPSDLGDLSPDFLPAGAAMGWRYDWRPVGWWQLTNFAGYPDWAVRYGVGGNDKGWVVVSDGVYSSPLDTRQPEVPPRSLSAAQVLKNTKEEFASRVKRHPDQIVHRQGYVAFLYKAKEFGEAREVCEACLKRWPGHWWPNAMLARLDAERGEAKKAEKRLRAWGRNHDDFPRRFFLADFLHRRGRAKDARGALLEAAKHPFDVLYEEGELLGAGAECYGWEGAMLAYSEGWYDVARAVCDRWEEYGKERVVDPGYLAIRTACHLALGEHAKAAETLAQTHKELRGRNYGWTHDLNLLERAVKEKAKSFRYAPKNRAKPWPLVIEYQ